MNVCRGQISKEILEKFTSNLGAGEFFSQAGNLVSIEQALAVLGMLSPDFIERDGHIFWTPNAEEYDPGKFPLLGFKQAESGILEQSYTREDIERYRNNFSISQFFTKWEASSEAAVLRVGLSEDNYRLCHEFAERVARYWRIELLGCFPNRKFQFEVADNLLDEFGVCLTFWQPAA